MALYVLMSVAGALRLLSAWRCLRLFSVRLALQIMLALFGVLAPSALRSGWRCMYRVSRVYNGLGFLWFVT